MSRTRPRPYKRWWFMNCSMCGKAFVTARRHADTCSGRCRVRLHRAFQKRFETNPIPMGWGNNPPPIESWPDRPAARLMPSGLVSAPKESVFAAQAAGELPRPRAQAARSPFPDLEALPATCASDLPGQDHFQTAMEVIGITYMPRSRLDYEKARKRVVNLLAAGNRLQGEKDTIREAWGIVQRACPYHPKVRSGSGPAKET